MKRWQNGQHKTHVGLINEVCLNWSRFLVKRFVKLSSSVGFQKLLNSGVLQKCVWKYHNINFSIWQHTNSLLFLSFLGKCPCSCNVDGTAYWNKNHFDFASILQKN